MEGEGRCCTGILGYRFLEDISVGTTLAGFPETWSLEKRGRKSQK